MIFYSQHLETTQTKIIEHGGQIIQDIFSFPDGRAAFIF